jgi:hypothetical protein
MNSSNLDVIILLKLKNILLKHLFIILHKNTISKNVKDFSIFSLYFSPSKASFSSPPNLQTKPKNLQQNILNTFSTLEILGGIPSRINRSRKSLFKYE